MTPEEGVDIWPKNKQTLHTQKKSFKKARFRRFYKIDNRFDRKETKRL